MSDTGGATHHFTEPLEEVPWCAAILKQSGIVTFTPTSRAPEDSPFGGRPTQDQLFRRSLNISDAIPQCIGFYQQTSDQSSASSIEHHADESVQPESRLQVMKCSLLFELRPGVNGYNGTAHGGIVAALIDEAMGNLLVLNTELQLQQKKNGTALPAYVLDLDKVLTIFTARMDMRLKRPIATPQVVIVKAIIKVIEGRKIHFIVTVEGQGEVEYASCESTWVLIRKTKL